MMEDLGREGKVSMSSRASTSLCPLSSVIIYKYNKCVYMYMYVSIAVSNGNREEDDRASARNPPSRGFHAPDGTRSSSTNRRSDDARPIARRVRKSCFFSDGTSEGVE